MSSEETIATLFIFTVTCLLAVVEKLEDGKDYFIGVLMGEKTKKY